uniref:Uncharacterized protein n=1 Tax=Acrobeloides nanus TaxID=290746 RepID=A0A914CBH0_9BILA
MVKRIWWNIPSFLVPVTDLFQLIYIPLFRKEIAKKLRRFFSYVGSIKILGISIANNANATWAEPVNSIHLQLG